MGRIVSRLRISRGGCNIKERRITTMWNSSTGMGSMSGRTMVRGRERERVGCVSMGHMGMGEMGIVRNGER